jgi:hypothetical protein
MFSTSDNIHHQQPIQTADEPAPKITHRWHCPECDNGITLHVRVVHAPVCNNKSVHSRRHVEMKRQKKGNPQ